MATAIATTIETILANVRDDMLAGAVVDENSVFICDSPEEGEKNFGLVQNDMLGVWWTSLVQGPGDYVSEADPDEISWTTSTLIVTVWNAVNVDETGRANAATTNQTFGTSRLVRAVVKRLNDQELVNADGDYLLLESLTFRSVSNIGNRGKHRRYDVAFDLKFIWDLTAGREQEFLQDTDGDDLLDTLSAPLAEAV